MENESIG